MTNIQRLLTGLLLAVSLVMLVGACNSLSSVNNEMCELRKHNAELNEKLQHYRTINMSYGDLLHRIWIDRPGYVEDVLWESEEFEKIDSIYQNNWEDVFEFWSEEDSINYYRNWKEQSCGISD